MPEPPPALGWPCPIHDTLLAYSWIVENLKPSTSARRHVYLYGSYLGASLATSVALTESHPHLQMGVRGCIAYNGIYNWTTFLPDHPVNKPPKAKTVNVLEAILSSPRDPNFQQLQRHAEALFGSPANLFDSFASSCLFFRTPGLLVPRTFNTSAIGLDVSVPCSPPASSLPGVDLLMPSAFKAPQRRALAFPPRNSTLRIPEMLLLHSAPPPLPRLLRRRSRGRKKELVGNHFQTQAEELAHVVRGSLAKLLRQRMKWDEDLDDVGGEIQNRVQVHDVGLNDGSWELQGDGEKLATSWLDEHL